jgi:hypothetical protein
MQGLMFKEKFSHQFQEARMNLGSSDVSPNTEKKSWPQRSGGSFEEQWFQGAMVSS